MIFLVFFVTFLTATCSTNLKYVLTPPGRTNSITYDCVGSGKNREVREREGEEAERER